MLIERHDKSYIVEMEDEVADFARKPCDDTEMDTIH